MTRRSALRAAVVVVAAVASGGLVAGCESIFGIGSLPFPPDAGADTSELDVAVTDTGTMDAPGPGDGGQIDAPEAGPPPCTPTVPYTEVAWAQPSPFPQSACTATQVSAYLTCFPNCDTFRQDLANAVCVSCIETDETANVHGPIVTRATGSQLKPVLVNVGGCLAHYDGMSDPGSCGNQEDNLVGCQVTECGSCTDFAVPASSGGSTAECEQMAGAGPCQADTAMVTASCAQELQGGMTSVCSSLSTFLPLWCAPPPVQPPPGCYAATSFSPVPWQPPTTFGQALCTSNQLTDFLSCLQTSNCATFQTDPDNMECLTCLESDVSATAYGPVVTENDGGTLLELNFGGCQAHFDEQTSSTGCGALEDEFNDCVTQECESCTDFNTPTTTGPTAQCEASAFNVDGGACMPYNNDMSMQCGAELVDGGAASQCDNFATVLQLWCGQ